MLGAVFKITGTQPLTQYPLKGEYSRRDFDRSARLWGIPFNMPPKFPVASIAAARGFYWLEGEDAALARRFAHAVYTAFFVEGRDIGQPEVVAEVADRLGIDRGRLDAGIQDPAVKNRLKEVTEDAIDRRGVFGSPFIFVDGEPFWGADRLDMVDRWLATGGW
jgi:2-hydroxychromene-2-carboxylate isomerase